MNEYDLKITVAVQDPDLEALRERREWLAGLATMRGALGREGGGLRCLRTDLQQQQLSCVCNSLTPSPSSPIPSGGVSDEQYVRLRSEAKAPFRLTRVIFLGGLAAGAAIGLLIIAGRLVAALQGALGLINRAPVCLELSAAAVAGQD